MVVLTFPPYDIAPGVETSRFRPVPAVAPGQGGITAGWEQGWNSRLTFLSRLPAGEKNKAKTYVVAAVAGSIPDLNHRLRHHVRALTTLEPGRQHGAKLVQRVGDTPGHGFAGVVRGRTCSRTT